MPSTSKSSSTSFPVLRDPKPIPGEIPLSGERKLYHVFKDFQVWGPAEKVDYVVGEIVLLTDHGDRLFLEKTHDAKGLWISRETFLNFLFEGHLRAVPKVGTLWSNDLLPEALLEIL